MTARQVIAFEKPRGGLTYFCRGCAGLHHHGRGGGPGHRVAHCWSPRSDDYRGEVELLVGGTVGDRVDALLRAVSSRLAGPMAARELRALRSLGA